MGFAPASGVEPVEPCLGAAARSALGHGIRSFTGRGGQIRTGDPLRPRQVRYQAALRPDFIHSTILAAPYHHPVPGFRRGTPAFLAILHRDATDPVEIESIHCDRRACLALERLDRAAPRRPCPIQFGAGSPGGKFIHGWGVPRYGTATKLTTLEGSVPAAHAWPNPAPTVRGTIVGFSIFVRSTTATVVAPLFESSAIASPLLGLA